MLVESVGLDKVLNSRGEETIRAEVQVEEGNKKSKGRFIAPSGASTGEHEAVEIPVEKAVNLEEKIEDKILNIEPTKQSELDNALKDIDGTNNFSNIGANTAIAISIAYAKSISNFCDIPLYNYLGGVFPEYPVPLGNVIGGGAHAYGAISIQEFLVAPIGCKNFREAAFINSKIHSRLGELLRKKNRPLGKGDEGAWIVKDEENAFKNIKKAIKEIDKPSNVDIKLGLDIAASELWDPESERYQYKDTKLTREEQIKKVEKLANEYNIFYIEDPLEQNDFKGFKQLKNKLNNTLICGDDLFVTNSKRLQESEEFADAAIIKPNQVGTLTETKKAVEKARQNGLSVVVSHRSGETEDSALAHIAVAFQASFIKTGVVGGERTAKLNEIMRIERL